MLLDDGAISMRIAIAVFEGAEELDFARCTWSCSWTPSTQPDG